MPRGIPIRPHWRKREKKVKVCICGAGEECPVFLDRDRVPLRIDAKARYEEQKKAIHSKEAAHE
jgi:hypothetical protein